MDDSTLTSLAIKEIIRQMNESSEQKPRPVVERKINPVNSPNKRFLSRTLNSIIEHNKRRQDKNRENCQRKLRHLDRRWRRRLKSKHFKSRRRERTRKSNSSGRSHEESTSTSYASDSEHNSFNYRRRKLKKKTKRKHRSRSCSSDGDESGRYATKDFFTQQKCKEELYEEQPQQEEYFAANYCADVHYRNYAAACSHIQHFYQFSKIFEATTAQRGLTTQPPTEETRLNNVLGESNLEFSESSLSLSLSMSSSCTEGVEEPLTIDLLTGSDSSIASVPLAKGKSDKDIGYMDKSSAESVISLLSSKESSGDESASVVSLESGVSINNIDVSEKVQSFENTIDLTEG